LSNLREVLCRRNRVEQYGTTVGRNSGSQVVEACR
jgi:hypothetical protein